MVISVLGNASENELHPPPLEKQLRFWERNVEHVDYCNMSLKADGQSKRCNFIPIGTHQS